MAQLNPLNLSITELMAYDTWSSYRVGFGSHGIFVTVTHDASIVCDWISKMRYLTYHIPPERIVVGVRFERKFNRIAQRWNSGVDILQLCVKKHCLIFQIGRVMGNVPHQLHQFLGDNKFTFVGVGMQTLSQILYRDHEIHLGERIVDLSHLCVTENNDSFHFYGIGQLCNVVLRENYSRPALLEADWDALFWEPNLVMYACADAFVCFRAGWFLRVWNCLAPSRIIYLDHNN